jgi:hypothetical protein
MPSIKLWGIFFPQFNTWLDTVDDPRQEGKILYPSKVLIWMGLFIFLLKLGARRQLTWLLGANDKTVLSHIAMLTKMDLSQLSSIACDDTVDDFFCAIAVEQLQQTIQLMSHKLIRNRTLDYARLLDEYYMIAIDATGLFHRHQPHCRHCLVKKSSSGELLFSHHVLEAKLVTENGMAFSFASEHIENVGSDNFDLSNEKQKQDCELKAFKRLAPKIKAAFPQLRICLLCDSLYAAATVMEICKHYGWAFCICYKEGSIPSVYQEFETLLPLQPENRISNETVDAHQKIYWATDIEYQQHTIHLIRSFDEYKQSNEQKTFLYLTNIKPTGTTVCALANGAGRQRWKIENQGFNMQKNGGYNLEHVYSENENAAKCFYLCLQIAHMINQLIEKGNLISNACKKYGSLKNLTHYLLDAIRFITIEDSDIVELFKNPFQIRFNSS